MTSPSVLDHCVTYMCALLCLSWHNQQTEEWCTLADPEVVQYHWNGPRPQDAYVRVFAVDK